MEHPIGGYVTSRPTHPVAHSEQNLSESQLSV